MLLFELITVYAFGALGYGAIELIWRGFTHWTMLLTGGLCCVLMYLISTRSSDPPWKKWFMCTAVITTIEFIVGLLVNIKLGWHVWDYSDRAYNLMGQICLQFTFCWFLLAIPAVSLFSILNKKLFFKMNKRQRKLTK